MELYGMHLEKPTSERPRALYQPLFSLTWYHDLPPFWTMFIPFYQREEFNQQELSLIDQRYAEMNNYLATGTNGLLNLENDLSIELSIDMDELPPGDFGDDANAINIQGNNVPAVVNNDNQAQGQIQPEVIGPIEEPQRENVVVVDNDPNNNQNITNLRNQQLNVIV